MHELSEDFISQFNAIEDYTDRGVGFCILHEGQVVCGVTPYSIYDNGIDIEIATHPNHRRKDLATIAVAALILDCLDRGMYPKWDAANLNSAKLAQKFGYILEASYGTYYIDYKKLLKILSIHQRIMNLNFTLFGHCWFTTHLNPTSELLICAKMHKR